MDDNPFAKFVESDNPFSQFSDVTPAQNGQPAKVTVRPQKPDVGRGTALGRGLAQGATFGFSDELLGAYVASGIPEMLKKMNEKDRSMAVKFLAGAIEKPAKIAAPSIGALRLGYEQLSGQNDQNLSGLITGEQPKGEATARYEEMRDAEREANKTAQEQYPGTYLTGQVAGGIASTAALPGAAATLPGRMAVGALTGAGVGGLTGFGEGEGLSDSAVRGAAGAAVGGVVGTVAPPIVEGAIRGGRQLLTPMVNAVRGAINPEAEASRRVVTAIGRDIQSDPNAVTRLTPAEFAASAQNGGPAVVMDLGGNLTRRLADSAAITSPEGGTALNQTINNRFEGQSNRITTWLQNTFNFPNAHAQQAAIENVARTTNQAAYSRAMRDGAGGVWDAELQRLAGAPAIQQASHEAIPSLANRGITEGFRAPRQNPLSFDPETGLAALSTLPNGNRTVPDLRFWDQVKKNLDGMITKAEGYGNTAKVAELTGLKNELVNNLDRLVPSYAQARAGAAHFFGAENALEAGQNFVTAKLGNREARDALARMTPQERQLFQDGFVSRYIETLNAVGDRRSVLNKIAESPEAREKLQMVLGQQRSAELEAGLRVEGIMDLARGAVQGNSWTARRLYDLGLAGGAGLSGVGGYNMDPREIAAGAVLAAISTGGKKIDQRVALRVAQLLTSNNPQQLQLGITLVGRNERMLENLRGVDRRIAAAGSQQTPNMAPAMQGAVPSRAQDEQQQAPRI